MGFNSGFKGLKFDTENVQIMLYQTDRFVVKTEALDAVVEGVNKIVSVFCCTYLNRLQ